MMDVSVIIAAYYLYTKRKGGVGSVNNENSLEGKKKRLLFVQFSANCSEMPTRSSVLGRTFRFLFLLTPPHTSSQCGVLS